MYSGVSSAVERSCSLECGGQMRAVSHYLVLSELVSEVCNQVLSIRPTSVLLRNWAKTLESGKKVWSVEWYT